MKRRWWVRGMIWSGYTVAALIGILLAAVLVATQSAYGRERVRQIVVRLANRSLIGSLHVGALRFGPGCALAIDSLDIRDQDDALLAATGPARATCRFGALVRGHLIITSLEVARPRVVVRESRDSVMNWSRLVRPDTTPPAPPPLDTAPARLSISGPIRVTEAAIELDLLWTRDSLRLATSDSAIRIDVHRVDGHVTVVGEEAEIDLPVIAFGRSRARVKGRIGWSAPGAPAVDARVVADSLAFADLAWLAPNVPPTGGARFELAMRSEGGAASTEYALKGIEMRTMRSMLRGDAAVVVDTTGTPMLRDASLEVAPLHTDLLRFVAGKDIPATLRGALSARVVVRGDGARRFRVDTLDARYVDETGAGRASRISGRGVVALGDNDDLYFSRFTVIADAIDARTVARVVPELAPLSGQLSGTVTLDSTLEHLRIVQAELRYAEAGAPPLRVTGRGRVDVGDVIGFNLMLDARPLAPAALARSYPSLAGIPSFAGPIEVSGTSSDLTFASTLRSVGGALTMAGRYRASKSDVAIRATVRLRELDPRAISGRPSVPAGSLAADVAVDLHGTSMTALQGTATLSNLGGRVAGVSIEPSAARFMLTESRVVAESLFVATSAGTVRASGALGRQRTIGDSLEVAANVSIDSLAPLLRALGAGDSTAAGAAQATASTAIDSATGTVTVRARLAGSIDSADVNVQLEGSRLGLSQIRADRVQATAVMTGLPSARRGHAMLRVDSVLAGGTHFAAVTAEASSDDGERWRVALGTAASDRPGGRAAGAVSIRADTITVELDSLAVAVPGTELRLTRPTRFSREGRGTIVLDTVELLGARGTRLRAVGVVRDTGSIAVSVLADSMPLLLPRPGDPADTVRARVDAWARVEGTAQTPLGTARVRMRLTDVDTVHLDSAVIDLAYADAHGNISAAAHDGARSLFGARLAFPLQLSLSPFRAELLEDSISGQVAIDSLYLPDLTGVISGIRASAGVLRVRLALSGTAKRPRADGNATLRGGAATIAALGLDVHDANATIDLTTQRLTIREASVRAGKDPEGRAELTGFLGFADTATTDLRLVMSTMPVMRVPTTADLDVSTDLRLVGPATRPTLSGRLTVDRGMIRLPDMGRAGVVGVDDTAFVRLVDSLSPQRAPRDANSSLAKRLELGKVDVVMGPNVWIRSAEASVQLGGSIGLERAAPQPGILEPGVALRGTLVTQRGNYRLNVGAITRSFELEQGSVQFTGEPELNPRLDINAIYTREGRDDEPATRRAPRVRAHLGGTLERPVLTLSSADAKLSQAELMSYLITGQTNFAMGDMNEGVVTSELVASATGALAQRLAGGHFDMVSVTAGSTSDDRDARGSAAANAFAASRLGVGKQLSTKLFVKVDAGLCALTSGGASTDLWQTMGVSLDYRFRRSLLGSISSAPSTNGAECANQAAGRGTALTPRQWGLDFHRIWRF